MTTTDPARAAAVRLLCDVEAGATLEERLGGLDGAGLDLRDRRFVHQLAAGTLKWRDRLDWVLDHFSKRPVASLSPSVRQILRLGAYQLLWLDRVPGHAAVHSAVDLARQHGHAGIAAFVNAVLRRVAEQGQAVGYPDRDRDYVGFLAVFHSHPRWLVARWLRRWGAPRTEALLAADNQTPALFLRLNPLRGCAGSLAAALPTGARLDAVDPLPDTYRLSQPEGFFESAAFAEGRCFVQDANAGLAAALLDARPGDRVLDLCAAPGGKTAQLAAAAGTAGVVIAADRDRQRLGRLRESALRLGLTAVRLVVEDGALPAVGAIDPAFDRVMVDAPCSGTGVLARHPEARWRKSEADLPRHAQRQLAILEGAFRRLRRGGVLVYSTCSLEEEENDAVVDRFLSRRADARLEPAARRFPGRPWATRTVQTLPGREPGDGAYAARLRRVDR